MGATATEARGLYVYGVTLANVDCGTETVDVGRLRAVVSEEPLERYEPAALEAALRGPGWLEGRLRAHDAVLAEVQAAGPVAPFRFGTIFRTETELREALSTAEPRLVERLGELRGASEWGVKAWVDDETLRRWFERHDDEARRGRTELDATAGTGRGYLLEKRLRRHVGAAATELALSRVHDAHIRLANHAREVTLDRPSGLDEKTDRRLLIRAAYLVPDQGLTSFEHVLGELRQRDAEVGLEYVLGGPWPPYSFVGTELT